MADRRGSSIAADVDAAIERVVDHFENNDLALRLDVLRALTAQSQLAFETTRVRQRLSQHPVSMDLIASVTSQSPVYKQLAERLTVDSSSCDYDSKRNVVMKTSIRWTLEPKEKKSKKRKKVATAGVTEAMITSYRYERVRVEKEEKGEGEETQLKFTVVVAFGDDDTTPKELVHFELACDHLYPKSYYEEMQQLPSDSEEEDNEEDSTAKSGKKTEKEEESLEKDEEDKVESFGEELRAFRFDNEVLADVGAWMGAGEEELDPVDVVGFFMALPVHEDEWLVDERVCEILFQGGLGAATDCQLKTGKTSECDCPGVCREPEHSVKTLTAAAGKDSNKSTAELEMQALNRLGVRRMLQWLEADAEAVENARQDEAREKAEGGIVAHNAWVRRKDRLRIRLPPSDPSDGVKSAREAPPPRFDFSLGSGVVRHRQPCRPPSSTAELMRNSGLKYVHAMSEGFQGRGGDLEKSRQLLVQKGHVLRDNFDQDDGGDDDGDPDSRPFSKDRYLFERRNNPALRGILDGDRRRREQSRDNYAAWVAHKALRDKAVKFLEHLPPPREGEESDLVVSSNDGFEDDYESYDDSGRGTSATPATVRWEEVGKALKAVDRTLLDAWVRWSRGFRGAGRCRALWESFVPVSCDVHCASSPLRDVFLKLLHRPSGVNYRQACVDVCTRRHTQALARGDAIDENGEELDEELEEAKLLTRYGLVTSRELSTLLRGLGLVLQPEETQRLVEFFADPEETLDETRAVRIKLDAFLSVVGDERRALCRGDTEQLLSKVCMWETVCHECGMLNAFQLVLGTEGSSRRRRAELPGHARRREQSGGRFTCCPESDMTAVRRVAPRCCAFAQWDDSQAAPFLKKLELWSAVPREQHVLRELVTSGQPPSIPMVERDDGDATLDLTTMLRLCWKMPEGGNGGAPAFYQLETAGAEGSASFRVSSYHEICRDPKDFSDNDGVPRGSFTVTGLTPNTKYVFRVRALNGFGAGAYTFSYFTTAPARPAEPLALVVGAHSVKLAWETSSYYMRRLRELEEVFHEADTDGNGRISRDEFMEEIERRKPKLVAFLQQTTAASSTSDKVANARPRLSPAALQAPNGADDQVSRLLKEWAQETSLDDGGVDFKARFDRYDVDGSGYLELPEFQTLLSELGVPPTPERLAAYLTDFDTDSDGKISFPEFARWWTRPDVHYVLKRDNGWRDGQDDTEASGSARADEMRFVCHRGSEAMAVVSGLEPNMRYHFRLRLIGAHASSALSEALIIYTAPSAPTCIGRIDVGHDNALIRWHPGPGGAARYAVECKRIETLTPRVNMSIEGPSEWRRVYDGREPLACVRDLQPDTVYRLRVFALNSDGFASAQSTVSQLCTTSKEEAQRRARLARRPAGAAEYFTIECGPEEGDLVLGDTVLFCERLIRRSTDIDRAFGNSSSLAQASVYSVTSSTGGSEAVGERTVAAKVVGVSQHPRHGNVLALTVVWSTVQLYNVEATATASRHGGTSIGRKKRMASVHTSSRELATSGGYALATDLKISRPEKNLYRFDTFRAEWEDESARYPSTWDR
ncbi:hypothetical protein JM16_002818 [Phytophthora kernoviae]|uniref:Calmodulin n=1 Tax=Phytophthora kernoviae TaxID=325452 RepID=A0A8T0M680_9STRA|nr:hypothetical protein JM16_002818 [Phytophthora kernoviae]